MTIDSTLAEIDKENDGIAVDTENLYEESIEGRVHSSGANYTGEYYREMGYIHYLLDDGEETAEKPETRMCIDVHNMQNAIHSVYILKENSDKDELLAAFSELENWEDEFQAQNLWNEISPLVDDLGEVLPADFEGHKIWTNHVLNPGVTFTGLASGEVLDVIGSFDIY